VIGETASVTADSDSYLPPLFWGEAEDEEDKTTPGEFRAGDLCPQCKQGRLDYDGLLNLSCPHCGYAVGGCFT
jgi:hypothetical protein